MKRSISSLLIPLALMLNSLASAQLPADCIAPPLTMPDINGVNRSLYGYCNQGKTTLIDFFAIWCGPCWNYHSTHALKDVYTKYGPNGTIAQDMMVLAVEGDSYTNTDCILGLNTCNSSSQGNWRQGMPYPFLNPTTDAIVNAYNISYFPTIYMVCPDKSIHEVGWGNASSYRNQKSSICDCNKVDWILASMENSTTVNLECDLARSAGGYEFQYRKQGSTTWTTVASPQNKLAINTLLPETIYYFKARVMCGTSWTAYSNTVSISTAGTPNCGGPFNLNAIKRTSTIADVYWTYLAGANVSYQVRISTDGTTWVNKPVTTVAKRTLTGLTPGTEYQCQVRANCGTWGAWSASEYFSTPCATTAAATETTDRDEVKSEAISFSFNNPVTDYLHLNLAGLSPSSLKIYTAQGMLVSEHRDLQEQTDIPVEGLPAGLYLIVLDSKEHGLLSEKMMKL